MRQHARDHDVAKKETTPLRVRFAEWEAKALKRVVVCQIEGEMKRRTISRAMLASRMKTNRATLDRLFAQNDLP